MLIESFLICLFVYELVCRPFELEYFILELDIVIGTENTTMSESALHSKGLVGAHGTRMVATRSDHLSPTLRLTGRREPNPTSRSLTSVCMR